MRSPPNIARWVVVGVATLMVSAGAIVGITPLIAPSAPTAQTSAEFSAERAMSHVAAVATEPRPMGSEAAARARAYIVSELESIGLVAAEQTSSAPAYYDPARPMVQVVNVVARIPGYASTGAVVLMGHYDTFPTTSGANDNAAAVGALLEVGRALQNGPQLRNDVILLFTDGEEPAPRYGSTAFVRQSEWMADVGFVMNLEAIGRSGPSMLVEINGPPGWIVDGYAGVVSDPSAYSFVTDLMDLLGGAVSDFDSFKEAGVPGVHLAYHRGSSMYHTAADVVEAVSVDSLGHHGTQALALARHFGEVDLQAMHSEAGRVWVSAGRRVMSHPAGWALPATMAVLVAAVAMTVISSRRRGGIRQVFGGAAFAALGWLSGVLAGWVAWRLLVAVRSTPAVAESYLYLGGLAAVSVLVYFWVVGRFGRRVRPLDLFGGIVMVWALLAVLVAAFVPGAAFAFAWPAIGGVVIVALSRLDRGDSWERRLGRTALLAAITIPMLAGPVDVFFQFAQPRPGNPGSQVLDAIVVVIMLLMSAMVLLHAAWQPLRRHQPATTPADYAERFLHRDEAAPREVGAVGVG